MNTRGNTVLVTGGTSGIGLAIAQAFSDLGNRILICGRSPDKLDAAKRAHPSFDVFPCDITRPDQVQKMFHEIAGRHPDLNVLVNNAGSLTPSDFLSDEGALLKAQQEVDTNFLGALSVTKSALPFLVRNGNAAIITISSIVAVVPMPRAAVYSATKAALHSFLISLRRQLQGTQVRVFEVMPSTVATELGRHIGGPMLSPRDVAQAVVAGVQREAYEIRTGSAKALYAVNRLSPSLAMRVLARAAPGPTAAGGE